jgi:formylglycine-generating enzyme required for sulfatase activity/tRNA A-37 threonylcarbamoyl transferase component Bud32
VIRSANRPTVAGYEIEGEIGRGAMGIIYKARQTTLHRPVALKMILAGAHADPVAQARFLIEAEAVSALQHPNIVQLYDYGPNEGLPYFALEFIDGGTVGEKLRKEGRFSPKAAAEMVALMADGMAAAHAKGIIHRDLKPANILLTSDGVPKITDFGLARIGKSDMTATGAVMGTPSYMSPEQAAGMGKDVGTATDVWSLGAILYDLLMGRPPFRGDTVMATVQQVLTREPERPRSIDPNIPRDLETICLKCLEKDQKKRYGAAAELAADLRAFLDGRPITARPVGTLERGWKWAKRHPGRTAGVAAGLLLLVSLLLGSNEIREQRAADKLEAEKQLGEQRLAAETKRLTDLREADEKRAADLKSADVEAKRKQRETRATSLVQALSSADTAIVTRLLTDLSEFRDLTGPQLRELAKQPVTTKPGLHARLALLMDEPGLAAELAAYLPTCRPEELLPTRSALTPHTPAVAPGLWAVLTDTTAGPARRVRAACALAGLAADDPRWPAVAPDVAEAAVRANTVEFVAWSTALEPVRRHLLPALMALYPVARGKIRSGKLGDSELVAEASRFDLTAELLARYAADAPELAELAVTVDARHFALFSGSIDRNKAGVVAILKAELTKSATPDWRDADLVPTWRPVDPTVARRVEEGLGFIHERFAFVESVPLEGFGALTDGLTPSGYRPTRVRPYPTNGGIRVAAVWQRDGVAWTWASGLDAAGVRNLDAKLRVMGYHPVDVAAWVDPAWKPGPVDSLAGVVGSAAGSAAGWPPLRFAAVWEAAPGGKPVNRVYLGVPYDRHKAEMDAMAAVPLTPLTLQAAAVPGELARYSVVWGKGGGGWHLGWARTQQDYLTRDNGKTAVDVTVVRDKNGVPRFSAVWAARSDVEVAQPVGLTAVAHLERARVLAAAGWRLASVAAAGPDLAASVWHRPGPSDAAAEELAKRRGQAAATLLTLGESETVWPVFRFPANGDPTARSYLQERLAGIGVDPVVLIRRFQTEADVSAKRALLIALGDYEPSPLWAGEREAFSKELVTLYREHPDAGLHGAIDWLLRQRWGKAKELAGVDAALSARSRAVRPAAGRDWYVNGQGQTYTVIRNPQEFTLGAPPTERGRVDNEVAHRKQIGRSFAIAAREVTKAEFRRFFSRRPFAERFSPDLDSPAAGGVSWYAAAAYCNWLSKEEGIPESQWCYAQNDAGEHAEGMRIKPGHLKLTGYRLPTEAEWEYACRSGSVVARYFGRSEELLPRYVWFWKNSEERAWPPGRKRPNDLGLFDTLGNVYEWVEDPAYDYDIRSIIEQENMQAFQFDERTNGLLRGGSLGAASFHLRCAFRMSLYRPSISLNTAGFRPARTFLD